MIYQRIFLTVQIYTRFYVICPSICISWDCQPIPNKAYFDVAFLLFYIIPIQIYNFFDS